MGSKPCGPLESVDPRDTFRSVDLGKEPEMRKEVSADPVVKDIRRRNRRRYSAEEKIGIVSEGLGGEGSIAEACRPEGLPRRPYSPWGK